MLSYIRVPLSLYRYWGRLIYMYFKSTDKWISMDGKSCEGGPGNSTVPIFDTEVDSLIHTLKVQISESVRMVSQYG